MFVVYVALISKMEDIRRVFQYHGAEHQTIHCYENGLELTPENCAQFETLHPRCGTSFIMFVFIISLLLFSFLGWPNIALRLLSRILLIPVVAGLSYELLRWAGRSDSVVVKVLSVPGLLMQRLTTKVPDESMLEVAIVAVNVCLSEEPPQSRIFDTDSKGNLIDREQWKVSREIAEGDISPEGRQSTAEKRNENRLAAEAQADVPESREASVEDVEENRLAAAEQADVPEDREATVEDGEENHSTEAEQADVSEDREAAVEDREENRSTEAVQADVPEYGESDGESLKMMKETEIFRELLMNLENSGKMDGDVAVDDFSMLEELDKK